MADQELALIDKVELRIALAATDDKFQAALDLYLCPLLLKLASPHQPVRQQILKFIQGVIPRLNGSRGVALPTLKLIEQAQKPNVPQGQDPSTVQLYTLLFASKGMDRLPENDTHKLTKKLATGISSQPPNVAARLFHLFCKSLKGWVTPDRGTDEFKAMRSGLALSAADELFLVRKTEQLFLLNPVLNNDGVIPRGYTCPGLSAAEVSFLTYDAGVSYKADGLSAVKKDLIQFVPLYHDENIVTLLEIGSVDSNDVVGNACAAMLRKITIPYEDEATINHIISLYVGDKSVPRSPVKPQVQERLLTVLNRSILATKHASVPVITAIGLNATRFPRLKSATISFIQWTAKNGADTLTSGTHAVSVVSQIRNNLHAEGWPRFEVAQGTNFSTELKHRRAQYEALGDILKRDPELIMDFSFIEFLFDSLYGDITEVRSTIQAALGGLMGHLPLLSFESKYKLKALMKSYIQDDEVATKDRDALHAVKLTALKFINATFPFDDAESRMLNVLATSTKNKSDIIEEAHKGLHPHWFNISQASNSTVFKSTSELLGGGSTLKFSDFDSMVDELARAVEYAAGNDTASLHNAMSTAIQFVLRVLVSQAIEGKSTVIVQDQEWETRIDKGLEFDAKVIGLVKDYLANLVRLKDFIALLLREFVSDGKGTSGVSHSSSPVFGKVLVKILSLAPQDLVGNLLVHIEPLLNLLRDYASITDATLDFAAHTLGLIASHPSFTDSKVQQLFTHILDDNNAITGSARVLSLSYLVSRLIVRHRDVVPQAHLEMLYTLISTTLESSELKLSEAAVIAIAELSKFGGFGPVISAGYIQESKAKILEALETKVKKLDEKAMIAWALLSLSEEETIDDEMTKFETVIYNTHNTKRVETLFTSGEAWSIIAAGWSSKFLQQSVDIQDSSLSPVVASRDTRLDFILTKVLAACSNTKPALRKAGCIWLLSLCQYCGHLATIKERSGLIHVAFMRFLSDRDELVQEAASRGLSIIYELGDNDLKDVLVKSLLKSFTESTSTSKLSAGTVSTDTELFEPGVLKTHDGSVSTYKDILSLASEVGDPSLVYKFMSMAKSSALWSSRKGIAFGLGSIMSKASLDKLLFENSTLSNRLIPKLYRYRFDPSPSVSKSMNDIWSAIVQDTGSTMQKYHQSILKELLTSMGNKEWRVREASTVALNDFIQSLPSENYQEKMEDIWTMAFRSIDDIKDSVRKAGGGLTRTLSQMLVNSISVESGSSAANANEALKKLLPFLLGTKGILSDADEVRDFALRTILDLVKKAGKAIKPFIAELLEQFILLMSTLEPQIINYLALNADKYKLNNDDIDAKRIQSVGSSPMMNALEKLVDLVDEEIMEDTVTRLQAAVKKSVGLPSKVAASRVVVMLIIRHLQIVKPYGETLLNTCVSQLKDRNTTVSSSFATASGYACRVCSVTTTVKYAEQISSMYFESEEEKSKIVAGVASEAVSKYSGDRFASVAGAFLPVAFIAKNDPTKEVAKPFEREWSENTSGNGAIKLYMQEICELVEKSMGSSQFNVRQIAAKSMAAACNAIDGSMSASFKMEKLFDVLLNACQGRSWSGKEDVLAALVSLAVKSKSFLESSAELFQRVQKVVITEAKRRNKTYQKSAIVSFGDFAHAYPSQEIQKDALAIFEPLLSTDYYESDDDEENKKEQTSVNEKSSPQNLKREADRMKFVKSLCNCFRCYDVGSYDTDLLDFTLKSLSSTLSPVAYIPTWRSQLAAVEGLVSVVTELKGVTIDSGTKELLVGLWDAIVKTNTRVTEVESVKVQTVRLGSSLIEVGDVDITTTVKTDLNRVKSTETNNVVLVEIANVLSTA